jgi:nucleoside-diphosphate-sugar epimerase
VSVLLTGATGFVGASVLARLLERDDAEVLAVVRGADPAGRLDAALDGVGVPAERRRGVRAVRGELTAPGLGLDRVPRGIHTVVHCAASVAFDLPLDEARAVNVGGTRGALEVAERAGARLVHVSTAYVAGEHRGRFGESEAPSAPVRNSYEQAKREADALVLAADRVPTVVLRPSIVVGEAATGWTPAFNVLYWPLRAFARGLLDAVPAHADGRVDVVPVDFVADAIVHVTRERPDVAGALHLVAGDEAVTVAELVELASDAFDRPRPRLVDPREGAALTERSPQAAAYLAYFAMQVVFGDARARAVLGPAGLEAPPLAAYFARLVAFAERARWGRVPVPRAA